MNETDENNNLPDKEKIRFQKQKNIKRKRTESPYFDLAKGYSDIRLSEKKSKIIHSYTTPNKNINIVRFSDSFFTLPCVSLAQHLLGKILVRKMPSGDLLKGIIVETESYLGVVDMASHSYKGKRTERNEAMYLKPGTAYVYSIYGMYYCFNISSLEEGSAVLIRALEPLEGTDIMLEHRRRGKSSSEIKKQQLCNGPSKLCQAFKIEKNIFNKVDLTASESLWVEEGISINSSCIISCKRIGIDSYGEEWANKPLRFYVKGNSCISRRCKLAEKLHKEKFSEVQ